MKTNHLLRKFAVVAICLAMTFGAKAVNPTAASFSELQTQFAAAVASGVPTTINITGAIVVNYDFSMVSTGDTITLNMVPFGISVTSGTLTIGNKVKITSAYASAGAIQAASGGNVVINAGCYIVPTTKYAVQALAGGTVIVNGGYIYSTGTSPVVAAGGNVTINGGRIIAAGGQMPAASAGMNLGTTPVIASGGTLTINGGYLATTTTGIARGIVVDYNGICIMNGGEVHSDMGGGRGISINGTDAGGKLYINGGIVSAIGATGRAIQLDNNNSTLWVNGSPTINGGLEGIMVQKMGVAIISGTPTITGVIGTNTTTAKLYDARGLSPIVATPGTGYYGASQVVSLTLSIVGTGTIYKYTGVSSGTSIANYTGAGVSPTIVTSSLVYTTDGTTPVAASTAYTTPVTVAIPSVLNVSLLIDVTTIGSPTAFAYYPTGAPATAAPTPPAYAAPKVTSIFSDAFTNVAGTDFNPGWGQNGAGKVFLSAGGNVLRLSNLNYQGIAFGSPVNALPMNYLHVDVYTTNETSLKISCISASTGEKLFVLTPLNLNAWNSYDIPLTAFTSQGLGISDLIQFKFDGSGGKTSYIDNLYFYNSDPTPDTAVPTAFTATAGTIAADAVTLLLKGTDNSGAVNYEITYGTTTLKTSGISGVQKSFIVPSLTGTTAYSFSIVCKDATGNVAANNPIVVSATTLTPLPVSPTPTRLAAQVKSIYSDAYTPAVTVTEWSNWWNMTFSDYTFTVGNKGKKVISASAGGCGSPTFVATPLDATGMTLVHVDVYPISTMDIGLQFITVTPTTANWVSLGTLTVNQWNSKDIPLTSFTNSVKTDLKQVGFVTTASFGTFYMDNLYFYTDLGTGISDVATNNFKCYPSQVIDRLTVKADTEISQVTVRNLLGQSVKSIAVNSNEQSIDLSAVSSGNYFVTVKLANGQSATQKIIKL